MKEGWVDWNGNVEVRLVGKHSSVYSWLKLKCDKFDLVWKGCKVPQRSRLCFAFIEVSQPTLKNNLQSSKKFQSFQGALLKRSTSFNNIFVKLHGFTGFFRTKPVFLKKYFVMSCLHASTFAFWPKRPICFAYKRLSLHTYSIQFRFSFEEHIKNEIVSFALLFGPNQCI